MTLGGDPFLVFANRYYVRRLGIEVNSIDYNRISEGYEIIVALDFDYEDQKLYFSDVGNHTIYRINIDGSNLEVIHNIGVPNTEGLAIDWVTK